MLNKGVGRNGPFLITQCIDSPLSFDAGLQDCEFLLDKIDSISPNNALIPKLTLCLID